MKFNDRELVRLGEAKPELEGLLHHMKPQGSDWSDWYQQPSFKERHFKLVNNLLFYYRVEEREPLGVLVLENMQVAYERPHRGIPFAFSVTFKDKGSEAKHIFACRCDDDVKRWVATLKVHSYEYWRSQFIILKTKIGMKNGQDPVLDYMRSKTPNGAVVTTKYKSKERKATFFSHVKQDGFESYVEETKIETERAVNVVNLIDL